MKIRKLIRNHRNFLIFVIFCIVLLFFDFFLNQQVIGPDGQVMDEKLVSFLYENISFIELIGEKNLETIKNVIKEVLEMRLLWLSSFSAFWTFTAEVLKKYIGDSSAKIYGITPKSYALFYSRIRKIQFTMAIIIISVVLRAHFTLAFISLAFIFYIVNILLLSEYSQQIKTGIKTGYIRYIKKMSCSKKSTVLKRIPKPKDKIKSDREIIFENECEGLVERLIIYSLDSNNKKERLENFDVLKFTIEIMKEFYSIVDEKTISFFIKQLQKSVNAFFIYEDRNIYSFEYYLNKMLNTIVSDENNAYRKHALLSLFLIIFDISSIDDNERKKYFLMIQRSISLQMSDEWSEIVTSIYIICFFKQILGEEILQKYMLFKNTLDVKSFDNQLVSNQDKFVTVYQMSKLNISCLYDYPNSIIDEFDNQFILIARYVGGDLLSHFIKYIEEVV